jgi:hypothetical protein
MDPRSHLGGDINDKISRQPHNLENDIKEKYVDVTFENMARFE